MIALTIDTILISSRDVPEKYFTIQSICGKKRNIHEEERMAGRRLEWIKWEK